MGEINLALSNLAYTSCLVDPVVVLSILDHYIRRSPTNYRVIGTLMGFISDDGEIEIRNSYPVPHEDSEDGKNFNYDINHHDKMLALHRKLYPDEVVVGWYATGELSETSTDVYLWYKMQMQFEPIHLLVSTDLSLNRFKVSTFCVVPLTLGGSKMQNLHFSPIQNFYEATEADRSAFDLFAEQAESEKPLLLSNNNHHARILQQLYSFFATISKHVEQIISREQEPDVDLARLLQYTFSLIPSLQEFESIFANSTQDSIMASYLANLIKSYLSIAEKTDVKQI